MAGCTFSRNASGFVVGVYRLVIVVLMTAGTGIGSVGISIYMTLRTGYCGMCSRKRIDGTVVES